MPEFPSVEIHFYADALRQNIETNSSVIKITHEFKPFDAIFKDAKTAFPVLVRLFELLEQARTIEINDVPEIDHLCDLTGLPYPYKMRITTRSNDVHTIFSCPSHVVVLTGCIRLWSYELQLYHGVLTNTVELVVDRLTRSFAAIYHAIEQALRHTDSHGNQAVTKHGPIRFEE